MSYAPPAGNAADFSWVGVAAYTPPAGNAANFSWVPAEALVDVVALVPIAASLGLAHGVAGGIAAQVPIAAALDIEYTSLGASVDIAALVPIAAAAAGDVGISAALLATVPIVAALDLAHGVVATVSAHVTITAAAVGAHGVTGGIVAALPIVAALDMLVPRYELRGEVRLGGVLVNRRVRAYLRGTGAMVGEADTVAGKFALHAGFAAAEHYITPVDLSAGATDWLPPTANRVVSVLALDAAA